jgi:hypothetical protein
LRLSSMVLIFLAISLMRPERLSMENIGGSLLYPAGPPGCQGRPRRPGGLFHARPVAVSALGETFHKA